MPRRYAGSVDVTEKSFETDVIEASKDAPVVVDFWAEWCGPCKALGPLLEEATAEKGVTLAKVDVDSNQALASEYGIRGIPAVKAFRNGHVVAEFVGAQGRAAIDMFLDELTKPPVAASVDDPELQAALEAHDYERAFELLLGPRERGSRRHARADGRPVRRAGPRAPADRSVPPAPGHGDLLMTQWQPSAAIAS